MQKHILHITFDMHIGGTEQVIRNLVEGLDSDLYRSSILCIDNKIGPWGLELQEKGFKHYCLKRQSGLDRELIKNIRKLIRSESVDIVHCHQYTPFTYGCFGALFTGKPVIFTEHGRFYPDFSTMKRKLINPVLQIFTRSITAISKATRDALVKYENLSAGKIEVIYNGIADLSEALAFDSIKELSEQLNISEKDIVFGTISRLDSIKNQDMMLRAFAKAHTSNNNIKLLIVGDGPDREKLEALTDSLDIRSSVIFTGFQSKPQSYLRLMDVFLLPSLSEGTSMTLLEAMSFSKPSIATAVGGTPEIIKDGQTGILIENKDEEALTEAINTLAKNSTLRDTLGKQARMHYLEEFTLDKMCSEYERLYQQILK